MTLEKQQMIDRIYEVVGQIGNGKIDWRIGKGYEILDGYTEGVHSPVMIGDVLEKYREPTNTYHILLYWKIRTKPIEDQSEDCITFIYNLVEENE